MIHKKYQHVERLGTDETEGIDIGVCYVFPKLDGTNASVWCHDGKLYAGSRNRLLTLDNDNADFYKWVLENERSFIPYFEKHPTHRLFGEWLVPHTLKTYREDAWNKLWIFDVYDDELNIYLPYDVYADKLLTFNLNMIMPSNKIKNPAYEQLIKIVEGNTFLIQDGGGAGEGIVVKNYEYQNKWGRQTWAKIVRNEFKENNKRAFGIKEQSGTISIESIIVEKYVTEPFVHKTRAKIENEIKNTGEPVDRGKLIPRLLQTCYHELISEEIWNIVKEYKNPSIDFSKLNRLVIHQVKQHAKELF